MIPLSIEKIMEETNTSQEEETHIKNNDSQKSTQDDKPESRYKDGQLLKFIRVRFPGHAKSYPFLIGKRKYSYGQKVVALSDRGMAIGYINSFPYEVPFKEKLLPIRTINKIASDEDKFENQENLSKEKEAEDLCISLVKKHNLDMDITHVEFTQFGKKAVFYFVAPERVDFRGLVKDLVNDLKMRIELRQISIRDRAASLGGIGPCGRQLCCSSFLSQYGKVNIKMAKGQNLALISSRINGLCGQLKCCLAYENDVYNEKLSRLPKEQSFTKTKNGDIGKVIKLHILPERFDMLTQEGKLRRYHISEYNKNQQKLPTGWKFPERFDHIINELSTIIGEKEKNSTDLALEIENNEIDHDTNYYNNDKTPSKKIEQAQEPKQAQERKQKEDQQKERNRKEFNQENKKPQQRKKKSKFNKRNNRNKKNSTNQNKQKK